MNVFTAIKRRIEMGILEKVIAKLIERSCKNYITTILGVISVLLYAAAQFFTIIPVEYQGYVSAGAVLLSGVALILAKDSGLAAPNLPTLPGDVKKIGVILLVLFLGATAHAQIIDPPKAAGPLQNIYAGGVSYSVNATPSVAGTGLYARLLSADTGTYAFTAVDALPNTMKPFTVTTNIGAGVAQKVFTIGKVPIYVPTAAGISFSGTNTGWQWNGGAMASIHIKGNYYVMPTVRFLKSSVANGTGYQPIIGILFGFGK